MLFETVPLAIGIALTVIGYLFGSISSAILICRLLGLPDPRSEGSRNPGTTNVLRIGGKKAAILTLAGDMLKGVVPVLIAHAVGAEPLVLALVGLAALLGHLYPVFFGFEGGKGVATGLGVLLALQPWLGLAVALTWLLVAYVSRYSSLASVIATIMAPIYYLVGAKAVWPLHGSVTLAIVVISVVILLRHKQNISRLLQGKESKIGGGKGHDATARKKARR